MVARRFQFSKRVFAAALRLAAIYATCVTVSFVMLLALSGGSAGLIDFLPFLGIPGAICFALAFILLAFARIAGFIALWLILLGLWSMRLFVSPELHYLGTGVGLVSWSIFAAPLYAMVAVGFPSTHTSSRTRRLATWVLGPIWLALVIVNSRFDLEPSFSFFWMVAPLSLIIPPTITAIAIRRIWRAKAPEVASTLERA